MEKDYWLQAWKDNNIGFHQQDFNPLMIKIFQGINLKNKKILVPLCGKSLDMIWFLSQGAQVIGVELSEIAVEDFFKENKISYERKTSGNFVNFISDSITISCGDLFDLQKIKVDYIYDRGSLVALPYEMRIKYAEKISEFIDSKTDYKLLSFLYDKNDFTGPPFSITDEELNELYPNFEIKLEFSEFGENTVRGIKFPVARRGHSLCLKK